MRCTWVSLTYEVLQNFQLSVGLLQKPFLVLPPPKGRKRPSLVSVLQSIDRDCLLLVQNGLDLRHPHQSANKRAVTDIGLDGNLTFF